MALTTAQIVKYVPLVIVGLVIPFLTSLQSTGGVISESAVISIILAFLVHEFEPAGTTA